MIVRSEKREVLRVGLCVAGGGGRAARHACKQAWRGGHGEPLATPRSVPSPPQGHPEPRVYSVREGLWMGRGPEATHADTHWGATVSVSSLPVQSQPTPKPHKAYQNQTLEKPLIVCCLEKSGHGF